MRLIGPVAVAVWLALGSGPAAPRPPSPIPVPVVPATGILDRVPVAALEARLRPADLVFRRGNGLWSGYFAVASGDEGFYSHVGVAVFEGGQWRVVHTEADDRSGIGGVRSDSLAEFLAGARGVAVVRPALNGPQAEATVRLAAAPDWRGIPFDRRFSLDDGGQAMYCTEWVQALVLSATGVDIARPRSRFGGRAIISVDDLRLGPGAVPVLEHRL
ncbi:YiiX/YebB-like N1pC/P60 family cysteine hydrolase [Arenimonas fontis]|uniref:Permuted papain-like amidase YaeF/Yiix C92 family enzyme n=1 Tax=Arenimonas fontis TaxID=2608255 RepID=A0A5B2ZC88_9GAMM|nr:YiiX/YebB-like N1pC/P60 family cysteine hydrolase [Arenimonas fontis]KAA2284890.1 hypothetical protein F0415_06440 [Arenimonas fontis]